MAVLPLGAEFGAVSMPSCSVGVAFYPQDAENADTLLSHAGGDMYRIKNHRCAQRIAFQHLQTE
ncbi:GGDEF domain-containing protein [Pseudomonas sp. 2835]